MSAFSQTGAAGKARIAVAGGGVIGMTCAFELSRRGHSVTVFDPGTPSQSTSWAAAGMIAPAYEVMLDGGGADTPLARLCFESAGLWRDFALAVQRASGMPVGYHTAPTLALARSPEEQARLEALHAELEQTAHAPRWIDIVDHRARLGLSGKVCAGLVLPDDHQTDNRRLMQAFQQTSGAGRFDRIARALTSKADLEGEGYDVIVWARGAQEFGVDTLVKGQALALEPLPNMPEQVLRFGSGYVVPKPDRIVIGATSEATYAHAGVREDVTRALLDAAIGVLPMLAKADLMEVWTGLRPKRDSGLPLIGEIAPGEFVAAAHHRNGILLAPATARRIADMIDGRAGHADAAVFAPDRVRAAT